MPTASPIVSESLEEDTAALVAAVDIDSDVASVDDDKEAVVAVVAVVAAVVKGAVVVVGPVHSALLAFTTVRSAKLHAVIRDTHLVPHHTHNSSLASFVRHA
jgi:hypothetical protein